MHLSTLHYVIHENRKSYIWPPPPNKRLRSWKKVGKKEKWFTFLICTFFITCCISPQPLLLLQLQFLWLTMNFFFGQKRRNDWVFLLLVFPWFSEISARKKLMISFLLLFLFFRSSFFKCLAKSLFLVILTISRH